MDDDSEPKAWVSALKVLIGIAVFVGTIGFGLWYADQMPWSSPALEQAREQVRKKNPNAANAPDTSWGISKDSPLRRPP